MARQPSIHITEKQLALVIEKVFDLYPKDAKEKAIEILKLTQGKQLTNRKISVSNDKLMKQATKVIKANKGDVDQLNQLIFYIRKTKSKLYIREKFKPDSNDYKQLKELANICNQFCTQFNFNKKEGYTNYLMECIPHISSSLNYVGKLINMAEKVFNNYENKELVSKDTNPKLTKTIIEYYIKLIIRKTGIPPLNMDNPVNYVKFIKVREKIEQLDIGYEDFIDAQFEGLAWTDNYPEPGQLINDKAIERLNKYIYKHNIKVKADEASRDAIMKERLNKLKHGNSNK